MTRQHILRKQQRARSQRLWAIVCIYLGLIVVASVAFFYTFQARMLYGPAVEFNKNVDPHWYSDVSGEVITCSGTIHFENFSWYRSIDTALLAEIANGYLGAPDCSPFVLPIEIAVSSFNYVIQDPVTSTLVFTNDSGEEAMTTVYEGVVYIAIATGWMVNAPGGVYVSSCEAVGSLSSIPAERIITSTTIHELVHGLNRARMIPLLEAEECYAQYVDGSASAFLGDRFLFRP